MMLVVRLEQLLGRQHLNSLPPIWDSGKSCPSGLYTVMLAGLLDSIQRRGSLLLLLLQLTGCPLGLTHSPPDKVESGNTHWRGE